MGVPAVIKVGGITVLLSIKYLSFFYCVYSSWNCAVCVPQSARKLVLDSSFS